MEQEQNESGSTVLSFAEPIEKQETSFIREDGVKGVGFFIPHGGQLVASVAWPDRHCERLTVNELERHKINWFFFGADSGATAGDPPKSETEAILEFLKENPEAANKDVVAALKAKGIEVTSPQVTAAKKAS